LDGFKDSTMGRAVVTTYGQQMWDWVARKLGDVMGGVTGTVGLGLLG
jgi:hypothetical protein